MTIKQYLRKASLIVGEPKAKPGDDPLQPNRAALDLSELRFRFSVRRGDTQTPNSADIRVYNVSDSTAAKVEGEFTRVVLQAGYEGNCSVIFDGTIMQVRRGRESSTDTYIDITAADGDRAYNFSTIAMSLAAGSKPEDHVAAVLARMSALGIDKGYVPESLAGNGLPRGKVLYGMSKDELREIAKTINTNWSIQDGKFVMVTNGAYVPGEIPVITSATGMVGMPEATQGGIRVKTLLNPYIKVGGCIQINNASIQGYRFGLAMTKGQIASNFKAHDAIRTSNDGIYCVMLADHSGDTRGNEWYTDVICLSADSMFPEVFKNRLTSPAPGPSARDLFG